MDRPTGVAGLDVYARLGGFLYLFVIAVFIAGDMLIGSFQVSGNLPETVANIRAGEPLYRTGIALQLLASVATILLGGAFYVLLRPVDRNRALFAFAWRIVETVIGSVAVVLRLMALNLLLGASTAFNLDQQGMLTGMLAAGGRACFLASTASFAFGSLLLFYLLLKSRFSPRLLAWLGIVASALVVLMSFVSLIVPGQAAALEFAWAPIFIAEILAGLWLLVRGADTEWWTRHAGEAGS